MLRDLSPIPHDDTVFFEEMAGDPLYTELLLGMGLRNFSMHPGSILEIKQQILRADLGELAPKVQRILKMDEPARIREAVERLTA